MKSIPPTPKKPKNKFTKRYLSSTFQADDEDDSLSTQLSTSILEPTPKRGKVIAEKKKISTNFINLSENNEEPCEIEKLTLFLGKNIFVENTLFKGVRYICLYRKEEDAIKNRFNIPLELASVLKKAVNMIVEKNNQIF